MPIEAEHLPSENAKKTLALIGRRVRTMRKGRNMTLQQLAEASGISSSMLSLVERGLASPSIGSLIVVANALGASVSEIMATEDHSDDVVVRAADVQPMETRKNVIRRVMKEDRKKGVSIAINEYGPLTASNESQLSHDGYEYGLLLAGTLTVEIDSETHILNRGDLISYASKRPHRIYNHGKTTARTVWFNTRSPTH